MNIYVVKNQKKWKHPYGDLLYGQDYIVPVEDGDLEKNDILPLESWTYNVWVSLLKMGFGSQELCDLRKLLQYDCPFSDSFDRRHYYYAVPVAIISKDINKYRTKEFEDSLWDIYWDSEWTRDFAFKNEEGNCQLRCSLITESMMGHGYVKECLPSDGSSSKSQAKILLNNGDYLGIITWIWHNK